MEYGHGKMKNAGFLFTKFVKKTYSTCGHYILVAGYFSLSIFLKIL